MYDYELDLQLKKYKLQLKKTLLCENIMTFVFILVSIIVMFYTFSNSVFYLFLVYLLFVYISNIFIKVALINKRRIRYFIDSEEKSFNLKFLFKDIKLNLSLLNPKRLNCEYYYYLIIDKLDILNDLTLIEVIKLINYINNRVYTIEVKRNGNIFKSGYIKVSIFIVLLSNLLNIFIFNDIQTQIMDNINSILIQYNMLDYLFITRIFFMFLLLIVIVFIVNILETVFLFIFNIVSLEHLKYLFDTEKGYNFYLLLLLTEKYSQLKGENL